jgi:hypothetical protein
MPDWGLTWLAEHLPDWITKSLSAAEQMRITAVLKDLGHLGFWSDGMLAPLTRIANGDGKRSDIDEIALKLDRTEKEVDEAIGRLRQARTGLVGPELGLRIMRQIDNIVTQKAAPDGIRWRLRHLVLTGVVSRDEAREILSEVDAFNAELERLDRVISRSGNE